MNRKIDLNESLNSAIEKMENAKKAYEWLKRNEETSNTQEQTEKFDIFKEISTVPDILLRCFVIEKGIPLLSDSTWKKRWQYAGASERGSYPES